ADQGRIADLSAQSAIGIIGQLRAVALAFGAHDASFLPEIGRRTVEFILVLEIAEVLNPKRLRDHRRAHQIVSLLIFVFADKSCDLPTLWVELTGMRPLR